VHVLGADTLAHATTEAAAVRTWCSAGLALRTRFPTHEAGSSVWYRPAELRAFSVPGEAVGFADPDARLAFAYVMNQPGPRWRNPRNRSLIDAVYASL